MNDKKKNRWPLFIAAGALVLFLGAAGLFWGVYSLFNSPERTAHQKLDSLLGNAEADEPQDISPEDQGAVPDLMNRLLADQHFAMQGFRQQLSMTAGGGVAVEETPAAYELRVPVQSEEDADNVSVNVAAHRIQIVGQTTSKSEHQVFSKTFNQSFSTPAELLPEKVSRTFEKNDDGNEELVITIPKKNPGAETQPEENQKRQPVKQLSPEVIRQLQRTNPEFI